LPVVSVYCAPGGVRSGVKTIIVWLSHVVLLGVDTSVARKDHRNAAGKGQAPKTCLDAWAKLIESEDELRRDLLSDNVGPPGSNGRPSRSSPRGALPAAYGCGGKTATVPKLANAASAKVTMAAV